MEQNRFVLCPLLSSKTIEFSFQLFIHSTYTIRERHQENSTIEPIKNIEKLYRHLKNQLKVNILRDSFIVLMNVLRNVLTPFDVNLTIVTKRNITLFSRYRLLLTLETKKLIVLLSECVSSCPLRSSQW